MRAPSDWNPIGPLVNEVLVVLTAMPLRRTEIEAVGLDGRLGGVPLMAFLERLFLGCRIEGGFLFLGVVLRPPGEEDFAMIRVASLRFDRFGPNLMRFLDVEQEAAVHGRFLGLVLGISPRVADDVILVRFHRVEVAERIAADLDLAVLDDDDGGLVSLVVAEEGLPALEVLAVEEGLKAVVAGIRLRSKKPEARNEGPMCITVHDGSLEDDKPSKCHPAIAIAVGF